MTGRFDHLTMVQRRTVLAGLTSSGSLVLAGHPARAAGMLNWMGRQGYDDPIKAGSFLADSGTKL